MLLNTERLLIRNLALEDVADMFELLKNPLVMEYSSSGPLEGEEACSFMQSTLFPQSKDRPCGIWGIELQATSRVIGLVALIYKTIDGKPLLELGYRLHPDYWGQGLASEAASALLSFAWDNHKVDKVVSIIDHSNTRSSALAERIGMHKGWNTEYQGHSVTIYQLQRPS